MRSVWFLPALFLLLAVSVPAFAGTGTDYNVQWSLLDPGNDWAAQVINQLFPVFGTATGTTTGTEATVIGPMLGEITGFVGAIAMVFVAYSFLMQVHRGAETSRLLGTNQTSMTIVRIGLATILMFPTPTGFSVGQAVVVQGSLWGIGMAKVVYANAVQTLGPSGGVIATPMVPGTKTIVAGLIVNELCRSLVNAASANPNMVPEPTGVSTLTDGVTLGSTAFNYSLANGNGWGSPTCGSVTVKAYNPKASEIFNVSIDQAQIQQNILNQVLTGDITTPVQQVAQNFWATKQTSALTPLMGILTKATGDYTARLTTAAVGVRDKLQSAMQNGESNASSIENYYSTSTANQNQLSSLGWTAAGAYYLEFARLNGQTLSLLSSVPDINPPSYDGLGAGLSQDLAPLMQSATAFMQNLSSYVNVSDGISQPTANGDLYSGAMPGSDGAGVIDMVTRSLHLSDTVLQTITGFMTPMTAWADPFGNLMSLGNTLILTSITVLGAATLLSSTTGTLGMAVFGLLSGDPVAAASTLVAHNIVNFLATPITLGCLSLLVPGLTLAFVLPAVPWVMWIAGVGGWLILVCEAVVAVPLWMLAHMTTNGEGLHGHAREGYGLLLNVIFRPTLMLVGLFLSYYIFDSLCWLIRQTFGVMAGFVLSNGWLVSNVLGLVVLVSIYTMAHIVAALSCFRMISIIPDQALRVIGFGDAGRLDMDQFGQQVAVLGTAKTLGQIQAGVAGALKGPTRPPNNPPGGGYLPPPPPPPPGAGGGHGSPPSPPSGGMMLAGPGQTLQDTTVRHTTDSSISEDPDGDDG